MRGAGPAPVQRTRESGAPQPMMRRRHLAAPASQPRTRRPRIRGATWRAGPTQAAARSFEVRRSLYRAQRLRLDRVNNPVTARILHDGVGRVVLGRVRTPDARVALFH